MSSPGFAANSVGASASTQPQALSSTDANMPSWYSTLTAQVSTPEPASALHASSGSALSGYSAQPCPNPVAYPASNPYPGVSQYPATQFGSASATQPGMQATTEFGKPLGFIEPTAADASVNLLVDERAVNPDAGKSQKQLAREAARKKKAMVMATRNAIRPESAQVTGGVKLQLILIGVVQILLAISVLVVDIIGKNAKLLFCEKYLIGIGSLILFGTSGLLSTFSGLDSRQCVVPLFAFTFINLCMSFFMQIFGLVGLIIGSLEGNVNPGTVYLVNGVKLSALVLELALSVWQLVLLCKHYRPQNSCKDCGKRLDDAIEGANGNEARPLASGPQQN